MLKCRLCQSSEVESILDFGNQPIVHNLLKEKDEIYERFSFNLGCCRLCGFLQLIEFIRPEILYKNYFTVSSWKFQPHVKRLIDQIEFIYHPNDKTNILEIGCNDGSFISSLAERGYKNVLGIEPTLDSFLISKNKGFNVINDFFNLNFVEKELKSQKQFDLVITRQVLEHISNLEDFLQSIRVVLKDQGGLIVEIPDHTMNLETLDYSLWEEHVNYFTKNSLQNLFQKYGFKIVHYETTLFSGKAMICYATKIKQSSFEPKNLDHDLVQNYSTKYDVLKSKLRNHLEIKSKNKKIYVYGCGARSCTLVNFFQLNDFIECYVDDQKEKQGYYVPQSLLKINPFEKEMLKDSLWVLGVNTENEQKVIQSKNLGSEVFSFLPPSRLLPDYWMEMIN